MEKAKILILYSHNDTLRVQKLIEQLDKLGVPVDLPENHIAQKSSHIPMRVLINSMRIIVLFITNNSINSEDLTNDTMIACQYAEGRDKIIIPVLEKKNLLEQNEILSFLLSKWRWVLPKNNLTSEQDYIEIAQYLYSVFNHVYGKELLYEKIANLSKINYIPGISSNLSNLIMLLCDEIKQDQNSQSRRSSYKELLRCLEQLQSCRESGYTNEDQKLARNRLDALERVNELLNNNDFYTTDLYFISFVLKTIYIGYQINTDALDVLLLGNVSSNDVETLKEKYLSRQSFYLKMYNNQIISENITDNNHGKYAEDEISFILEAKKYLIQDTNKEIRTRKVEAKSEKNDIEKQLHTIADYIKQINKLFEQVNSNQFSASFLKCLKTSYERLRKYSEVVNCMEICAECIERIAEINQLLEQCEEMNSTDDIIESGLKALLGFSLPGKDDFDVFLSYKHEDKDIVRSIYHFLKSNILHPFFDSISLPELSKSDYEDAIMNAIEHSKHFIVVISNLEYLNSYWVELEMKTFRHEIVEGRKKDANFILIVTNDVFQKIVSTNKQCLPIKYRSYEIMRVDDYKDSILKYLK